MAAPPLLILGGTTEAAALARALDAAGAWSVTTSLAGRTASPAFLPGRLRIGGFGGTAGLVRYLRAEGFAALVDATHPFAARMATQAAAAADAAAVPRIRLLRPEWRTEAGDRWIEVPDIAAAAAALAEMPPGTAFLTIGRQEVAAFAGIGDRPLLLRSIEAAGPLPDRATTIRARGPFALEDEIALMRAHRVSVLVTKNAGGTATRAKLDAARVLGLPVVMVARPPQPPGPILPDVAAAMAALADLSGRAVRTAPHSG